jgi:transposase InsO family protein
MSCIFMAMKVRERDLFRLLKRIIDSRISFNGKLRQEKLNGEIFYALREAQVLIEQWRLEYNTLRPHSSLKYRPPAPEAWLH